MNPFKKIFSNRATIAGLSFALGLVVNYGAEKALQDDGFKNLAPSFSSAESVAVTDLKVREDDQYVYYDVFVPELDEKNVKVKVDEEQVTVSGKIEKKNQEEGQSSVFISEFHRSYPTPENVDPTKVKIHYDKDKVTVQFPKNDSETSTT